MYYKFTLHVKKERIHLSFPLEAGRAAEASQSLFSHTDGKIRNGDGCGEVDIMIP
jgi:hypothetical protein